MTSKGIVIAGGGLAAQRAAETLRRTGYGGPLRMIAAEPELPYDRPPLSKQFLAGELDEHALSFRDEDWYADHAIDLVRGDPAARLDVAGRAVVLASGRRLPFARLLIATGSALRRLPGTAGYANVHELRSLADAHRLRAALAPGSRVLVVGAGFIGQEVAATARQLGTEVTMIEAAEAPLAGVLGVELGRWFAQLHRQEGIDVRLSARIDRLHGHHRAVTAVELDGGQRIACDTVVVGIGTEPATGWLASMGLGERGVPVDATRRHRHPRRLRRRRRQSPVRPAPRRARTHRALGRSSPAGRRCRPGDAGRGEPAGPRTELLERPARPPHPVRRSHPRCRRHDHRRRPAGPRLHRHLHPLRPADRGVARRPSTRPPRAASPARALPNTGKDAA